MVYDILTIIRDMDPLRKRNTRKINTAQKGCHYLHSKKKISLGIILNVEADETPSMLTPDKIEITLTVSYSKCKNVLFQIVRLKHSIST